MNSKIQTPLLKRQFAVFNSTPAIDLYLFSFSIAAICYFFNLANFSLPIDGEPKDNFIQTITLGRWFHAILRLEILPEPFIPYFTNLISLIFLSFCAVLAADVLRMSRKGSFIFCALFVSFPNLAYQFEFINQSDTISIGYCLAVASAAFYCKILVERNFLSNLAYYLLGSVTLCLALGIYQSMITVTPILILGHLLTEREGKIALTFMDKRAIAWLIALFITAVASYALISLGFQSYYKTSASTHISTYFATGIGVKDWLIRLYHIGGALARGKSAYGFDTYVLATLAAFALAVRAFLITPRLGLLSTAAISLILGLPFLFTALAASFLPPRIYVAANLSFALLVATALDRLPPYPAKAAAGVLCLIHAAFITQLFNSDLRVRESDILLANRIQTIAEMKYGGSLTSGTRIYFHGKNLNQFDKRLPDSDVFGSSFFLWDGGNTYRITRFFDYYGIGTYQFINREDIISIKPILRDIPKWPNPDSVQLAGDVLIVKLGDEFGYLPFSHD